MDKKRKRTGLTKQNVFDKKKYKPIIALIFHFGKEKIRFAHLKYVLVENHNIKSMYTIKRMEDFFISEHDRKMMEMIKIGYTLKELSHKEYVDGIKLLKKGYLNQLKILGFLSESDKFMSEQGLRNALSRIKTLGIIQTNKSKKGYPYYTLTDEGFSLYIHWKTHYLIDVCLKDDIDALIKLHALILNRAIEKKIIDANE